MWRWCWSVAVAVVPAIGQGLTGVPGWVGGTAHGVEALQGNPAGLVQSLGRWEISLPALSALLIGMTPREYVFYFGGVETGAGYRARRLSPQERAEFAALLDRQPVSVEAVAQPLALLWKPSAEHALAAALSLRLWMHAQGFDGIAAAGQQSVLGAEPLELRARRGSLRVYSTVSLGYARQLWRGELTVDTGAQLRWGELTGGIVLHLYRGHRYEELSPETWVALVPFLPPSWDSTLSWDVSGYLQWWHAQAEASLFAYAFGVAPAVGWGAGISVGVQWEWKAADTLPAVVMAAFSVEDAGFIRWRLQERTGWWQHDTISGILGSAWDRLEERFTPQRHTVSRIEAVPIVVRLGGAVEVAQLLGVSLPVQFAVEYQQRFGAAWGNPGGRVGVGVMLRPLVEWLPAIGIGAVWSAVSSPQFPLGIRWQLPALGRHHTVIELGTSSLSSWLLPTRVWHFGGGARVWMYF